MAVLSGCEIFVYLILAHIDAIQSDSRIINQLLILKRCYKLTKK